MSRLGRSAPGYTLLEVMIVVSVLGLALAAGTPYMSGYLQSKNLQNSVTELASRFNLARSRAVTEHNSYRVVLNQPADGEYLVHDDDNNDGSIDGGESVMGPFMLPAGVQFHSVDLLDGDEVSFVPSGMLSPGQGGSVTLADDQGRLITLEVFTSGLTQIKTCS